MYKIIWTPTARKAYLSTLKYWAKNNCSNNYPKKIISAVIREEIELQNSPLFLAQYIKKIGLIKNIGLYRKFLMKGKFALYYRIDNKSEEKRIVIRYFRSTSQKPL